jgi:hypothetical protein
VTSPQGRLGVLALALVKRTEALLHQSLLFSGFKVLIAPKVGGTYRLNPLLLLNLWYHSQRQIYKAVRRFTFIKSTIIIYYHHY